MTKTKQKEVWKVYPEFDFIEVSNLGRVRTKDRYVPVKGRGKRLIKGRVLKQKLLPCGYMYVQFHTNGKNFCLRVHRLVAIAFVPNPNNYPEVNHIDNDRTNNVASNLEWCTRQYNLDYKKNFGTSPADIQGRPVFAINLETGKVLRFETQSEATRQLGIDQRKVNNVIRGRIKTTHGYVFTEDESEITEEKIQEIRSHTNFCGGVIAVNLETKEVFYFESQAEAARQLGVYKGNIYKVLKGKLNKTGSCWFCCADGNAVENTREKFGDEMANKVKKLTKKETERVIV